ncbi:unnamed protein product [Rotaria sp. Silwood2]|nr:unnamed protein product [Rotaria sp. Silwood2]
MNDFKLYAISIILCLYILLISADNNETIDSMAIAKPHAKVCGDIRVTLFELRRGFDAHAISSCEISLGSVTYAPMHSLVNASTITSIRFPNLREVYGYMLLGYSSMRSFSSMFPRLSVIHGRDLYHGYSLIVMDNFALDELGLTSLINIRRGNIIIARNAQLCYAESLRWNDIMETKKSQVISRQNRDNCAFCPTCPSACWSPTQCQQRCSANCQGNCLSETICCPDECVGGCHYNNSTPTSTLICNACRNMRIYSTGTCVQQCPENMLKAGGSLCVTRQECTSFFLSTGYILEEINECVASCPSGFIRLSGSRCIRCTSSSENNYCNGACREKHIRSIGDFQSLKYCSRIHTLNIYNIETVESSGNNFLETLSAFSSLKQIDHEFTIHNVKIFSTLSIFSQLHRIGITSNASLTIEENEFLTELWPSTQQLPIVQGSVNIVRNARLCLKHIENFINYTTANEKELQVTNDTRNPYANGYLASCESSFLKITIDKIRSLTARINVAIPKESFLRSSGTAEHLRRPFLSVYYKTTRTKNETHFDATHSRKWLRVVEKVNYNPAPHGKYLFELNINILYFN